MADQSKRVPPLVTQPVRIAFPNLFKPRPKSDDNPTLVYDAAFLFPPDYDMTPIADMVKAVMLAKWGKLIKIAEKYKLVHQCDDVESYAEHAGWKLIRASSQFQPIVIDGALQPVLDAGLIYSGCWVRAKFAPWAFDNQYGKGVGISLDAVQFVRKGDRLGRTQNIEGFEPLAGDESLASGDDLDDVLG